MKASIVFGLILAAAPSIRAAEPRELSGIYPSLAMYNNEGECGTGAVVPWADRLWVVTYGPHLPFGSSDKLYEITPDLRQNIRPESVGGTAANRMIHRESNQLLIGPYLINAQREVRVIPPSRIPGRLTGSARHLTDPANKAYYATMEEGLYEVDVNTLAVTSLIRDGNTVKKGFKVTTPLTDLQSNLPGYHGKGLYSGQGCLIYANNGDRDPHVLTDPATPSGALGEWRRPGDDWQLIRRNQFTEITGPNGIYGSEHPETDPVWTIGWDFRSLILMCLDAGQWHVYRLPKASHCYDGAHGWNTEWPRIRDIGEKDLLMTMHGSFWRFPRSFTASNSGGIAPRSTYLKVVGDFTRWGDRLVFGCDDSAKSEFLNKRKAKGRLSAPGRSQSNLWFVEPESLDHLGPALGHGAVWMKDNVKAGDPSDAYLFGGFAKRSLHLTHDTAEPIKVTLELDAKGDGRWQALRTIPLDAKGYAWTAFPAEEQGAWIRLRTDRDATAITAFFEYRNDDDRRAECAPLFDGLTKDTDKAVSGGVMLARGGDFKTLRFIAQNSNGGLGCYDLDGNLALRRADDPEGAKWTAGHAAIPHGVITIDTASVLYEDNRGRWRLPIGGAGFDRPGPLGDERICREVCTERDIFNAAGTFFELPAENAGGMAKIRPIATHNRRIKDYASYRGLAVISGLREDAQGEHIIRSDDGKAALWVGAVDDLWQLGKPRGLGGPWRDSAVRAGHASDPYLMTGYDKKSLSITQTSSGSVRFTVQIDISGTGLWRNFTKLEVPAGQPAHYDFPAEFSAYWVRLVADKACKATAVFDYR